ncbi:cytochrome o ubiquinol oxidase subunit IV [Sphingomonas carotinifaciens]|uniref:cytochrome o ubiquinol oxidase subunit IV n=1 Tax=Sphingomonas TaxID=13687 RepID=UPI00226A4504|nr:cytochrome o ubiquinol oxidase subunit IV [Sphingomonas sp. GM_Shp_2]
MSDTRTQDSGSGGLDETPQDDKAPGSRSAEHDIPAALRSYAIGFGLAAMLTAASFYVATSDLVWGPGIPVALVALAIGQMGVHLVFFLHITTGPDNTNNVLALAFGVLIVGLVLIGSLWIMNHLDHNLMGHGLMQP